MTLDNLVSLMGRTRAAHAVRYTGLYKRGEGRIDRVGRNGLGPCCNENFNWGTIFIYSYYIIIVIILRKVNRDRLFTYPILLSEDLDIGRFDQDSRPVSTFIAE